MTKTSNFTEVIILLNTSSEVFPQASFWCQQLRHYSIPLTGAKFEKKIDVSMQTQILSQTWSKWPLSDISYNGNVPEAMGDTRRRGCESNEGVLKWCRACERPAAQLWQRDRSAIKITACENILQNRCTYLHLFSMKAGLAKVSGIYSQCPCWRVFSRFIAIRIFK